MDYSHQDIKRAYKEVGIEKGRIVLLKTDLRFLGAYENTDRNEILKAHFNALSQLIDLNVGTLVVPTSTLSLCNTDKPFDPGNTPSESGVLTEYIRRQEGAIRSFHPFISYAAIGKYAKAICEDISRHAFGPETPKARMLDLDTMYVSVGQHPRCTCSVVHHIEMIMGVPYRYIKEFKHPVVRDGKVVREPFYMYVYYRECDIKRNRNVKIFDRFFKEGYTVEEASLGRGKLYAYKMADFYKSTIKALKDDIYIWLDELPKVQPYQK
jgi:aminoglycoside 3-N-acetyltransferase